MVIGAPLGADVLSYSGIFGRPSPRLSSRRWDTARGGGGGHGRATGGPRRIRVVEDSRHLLGPHRAHGEILARWGRSRPDKVAFVCGERSVTYAEIDRRANAVANAFAGGGWPRGTGWACSWATTSSMSRSCSGVPPRRGGCQSASAGLARGCLRDGGQRFVGPGGRRRLRPHGGRRAPAGARDRLGARERGRPHPGRPRGRVLRRGRGRADHHRAGVLVTEHDFACIMYTSGTTGRPKGALLSHFNLFMSVNSLAAQHLFGDDEVWYGAAALPHRGPERDPRYLMLGATSVIVPLGRFDAAKAVDDLLERTRSPPAASSRCSGTRSCRAPRRRAGRRSRCADRLGDVGRRRPAPRGHGGSSRASHLQLLRPDRDELGHLRAPPEDFGAKIGSVGRPVMAVEAAHRRREMRDVAPGEVGEIVYRGPTVMQAYWGLPRPPGGVRRGVVPLGRPLPRRRRGVHLRGRPQEGHDHLGRGEHLLGRGGGRAASPTPAWPRWPSSGRPTRGGARPRWPWSWPADPGRPPTLGDLVEHCRERLASYKKPTVAPWWCERPAPQRRGQGGQARAPTALRRVSAATAGVRTSPAPPRGSSGQSRPP